MTPAVQQEECDDAGAARDEPESLRAARGGEKSDHAAFSSGQPPMQRTVPQSRTRRAERPRAVSQPGASSPSTTDAVLATFASTQDAAATLTVRHGVDADLPVRGSMTWWHVTAPARHRRTAVPDVARPPAEIDTTGPTEFREAA